MADDASADLVADLAAEQDALVAVLEQLEPDDWFRPTPAWSWDVRDTVSHLADTDELAVDTCIDGPRALAKVAARCASSEDLTLLGVPARPAAPRSGSARVVDRGAARGARDAARSRSPDARAVGAGDASAFVRDRPPDGDVGAFARRARGPRHDPVDTDRLRHVAWIGVRALPYAASVAGVAPPEGPLRVELTLPSGAEWTFGAVDAPDRITGPASEFCRVFVQRIEVEAAPNVVAEGPGAQLAMRVARSYL